MSNWMHRQIMSEARACDKINRTEKNKQARCDVSKQDQAARIARRIVNRVAVGVDWPSDTERAIRRAITAAVRKERERCVGCAVDEAVDAMTEKRFVSAYRIMQAIDGNNRKKNIEYVRMIERHDSGVRKATAKQLDKATKAIRKGKA